MLKLGICHAELQSYSRGFPFLSPARRNPTTGPSILGPCHVVSRPRLHPFSPLSIRPEKSLSELMGLANARPSHRHTPSCQYRESCLPLLGSKCGFDLRSRRDRVWYGLSNHRFAVAHSKHPCQAPWWVHVLGDLKGRGRLELLQTRKFITYHVMQHRRSTRLLPAPAGTSGADHASPATPPFPSVAYTSGTQLGRSRLASPVSLG